jgi:hypothetical protein
MAEVLSPGMAAVLERLVAGHVHNVKPTFNAFEHGLLLCAGAALSVVNRTNGAASEIGRQAAHVVSKNRNSAALLQVGQAVHRRLMLR